MGPTDSRGERAKTPTFMHSNAAHQGFTLLELLVVLSIAALTVGAAILWLPKTLESARFREVVLQTQAILATARTQAIESAFPQTVRYETATRTLFFNDQPRFRVPEGIELEWTVADLGLGKGNAAIRFWPEGGNTGGTVVVHRNGQAAAIRVDWLLGHLETYPVAP